MHYDLAALFAWAADCILLSFLLLPLWLKNKDRQYILIWFAALLLMGIGLLGLILSAYYAAKDFALPLAALVGSEALSTAGAISLYGAKRPLRFTLTMLVTWLISLILFHISGFGSSADVASYFFADIIIAFSALHFLFFQARSKEVRLHFSMPIILSIEIACGLVIAILFLSASPSLPDKSTLISFALTSGFLLFSAKVFQAAWLAIEQNELKLKMLAFEDSLTGILNRRGFFQTIEAQMASAGKSDLFAYLTIDIDHFKLINDRFGHASGDQALISFTRNVKAEVGETGVFGRVGGEEFAIFLPVSNKLEALGIAEKIRTRQAQTPFCDRIQSSLMTISIGIGFQRGRVIDLEQLLSQSDRALYNAKHKGRNCVMA